MSLPTRQRIPRQAKKVVKYSSEDAWFPDCSSNDEVHIRIALLNSESYPFWLYSLADDLLIRSLFGSKDDDERWNSVTLESSSHMRSLSLKSTRDDIRSASEVSNFLTNTVLKGSIDKSVANTTLSLMKLRSFRRFEAEWEPILNHLLWRYTLLYQPSSPVHLCKVQFNGSVALGLRARRDISPGSFIMETCSSMSSDVVPNPGPSIIESNLKQLGPSGPRAILGPLRFANHDCNPRAQFFPIPGTHAYVLLVVRWIMAGEEVTVKYASDGYYRRGECRCYTCTKSSPCQIRNPKRSLSDRADGQPVNETALPCKKKIRRGLKKGKARIHDVDTDLGTA